MKSRPTDRQQRAIQTRNKLVSAAKALLVERSFDEITIEDIAKKAGVATGSFYTYFKRKEDIIDALNRADFYRLAEIVNAREDIPFPERLRAYSREFLQTIERTGIEVCRQWIRNNLEPTAMIPGGPTKYLHDYGAARSLFEEAVRRGELQKNAPLDECALLLNAALYGLMVAWCMTDSGVIGSEHVNVLCDEVLVKALEPYKTHEEKEKMEYVSLNNGGKCPVVGIGTFLLAPADAENSVREALKMGYRLIDTANAYVNERAVGRGIKESGVARKEIFLSTKLWPSEYENESAVDETLERLGTDYVDLLYIHQPAGNWLAGYRLLEKAYRDGKARAIGISNFEGKYIAELETEWEIAPQFIQAEAHPYFTQDELRVTLDKYGIRLMAWYPLGHGDPSLIQEPIFASLAEKYGKSPAQVILRWHTQMGFVVIPGSKNVDHIRDNLHILDFSLTDEEMAEIARLNKGVRYYTRTDEALNGFASFRPPYEQA